MLSRFRKYGWKKTLLVDAAGLRGWGAGLEIFISNVEESKLGRVGMILKEEIEERYSRLVGEMFSNAVRDIKRIPERVQPGQRRVLLMNSKRDAIKWIFRTRHFEWWCGLLGVSSLRIKRLVSEMLNGQRI